MRSSCYAHQVALIDRSWPTLAKPTSAKPTLARVSVLVVWPTWAKTDFGQTDFGQNRLWPKPTLAKTDFGQTDLAKTSLICCVVCCVVLCLCVVCVAWVLVSRYQSGVSCVGVGFKIWFGPPFPWTAQNFALFSLSRRKIRSFLPSLGVFSLNFGGVFEGWDPQMCTFGLSGCRVKPRGPPKPPGLHTTTRGTPNAHI